VRFQLQLILTILFRPFGLLTLKDIVSVGFNCMIFFTQNWEINYLKTHFNGVNENGRLSNFTLRHNLKDMNNKVKISKNRKISFSVSKPKGLNSIVKISWSWNLTKFLPQWTEIISHNGKMCQIKDTVWTIRQRLIMSESKFYTIKYIQNQMLAGHLWND
jgi:hypothetical protein